MQNQDPVGGEAPAPGPSHAAPASRPRAQHREDDVHTPHVFLFGKVSALAETPRVMDRESAVPHERRAAEDRACLVYVQVRESSADTRVF